MTTSDDETSVSKPERSSAVKKALKRLRQKRTIRRKLIRAQIADINGLGSDSLRLPEGQTVAALLAQMTQHRAVIGELNEKIEELLDGEEELNSEFGDSQAFDIELGAGTGHRGNFVACAAGRP